MNDPVYYHTLTPLAQSLAPFAGTVFLAAMVWHLLRAARDKVAGPEGHARFADALLAPLIFIVFYVSLPNPNTLTRIPGMDPDLADLPYPESTAAVFLLERLAVGVDEIAAATVRGDMTVTAQFSLGEFAPRVPGDVLFNFIQQRARFLTHLGRSLVDNAQPPRAGPGDGEDGEGGNEGGGLLSEAAAIAEAIVTGDAFGYLGQQLAHWTYALGATLSMLAVFLVIFVIAGFVYLLAGIFKFAGILIFAVAMFLLPFGYLFQGWRFLRNVARVLAFWLFIKAAIVIVVWTTFFLVEGVFLAGWQEVLADSALTGLADRFEPGFLYTRAGTTLAFHTLQSTTPGGTVLSTTVFAMLTVLLTMLWVLWRLPATLHGLLQDGK